MIHATKHGSLISVCSHEVQIELPCSRCRLDCRQSSTSTRGHKFFYGSDRIVSLYVANTMRWQPHFLLRVGFCSPPFRISSRRDGYQKLRSTSSSSIS